MRESVVPVRSQGLCRETEAMGPVMQRGTLRQEVQRLWEARRRGLFIHSAKCFLDFSK